MARMNKEKNLICEDCGSGFISIYKTAPRCPECRVLRNKEMNKARQVVYRAEIRKKMEEKKEKKQKDYIEDRVSEDGITRIKWVLKE